MDAVNSHPVPPESQTLVCPGQCTHVRVTPACSRRESKLQFPSIPACTSPSSPLAPRQNPAPQYPKCKERIVLLLLDLVGLIKAVAPEPAAMLNSCPSLSRGSQAPKPAQGWEPRCARARQGGLTTSVSAACRGNPGCIAWPGPAPPLLQDQPEQLTRH